MMADIGGECKILFFDEGYFANRNQKRMANKNFNKKSQIKKMKKKITYGSGWMISIINYIYFDSYVLINI